MLNKVYVWKMFAPRNILNNQIPNKAQTFGNGNSKYFFFQGQNILSKKFTTCINTETTNFLNQICKYFSPLCSPAALLSTARRPSAQNFSILAFK